jgi:hypothetical protein
VPAAAAVAQGRRGFVRAGGRERVGGGKGARQVRGGRRGLGLGGEVRAGAGGGGRGRGRAGEVVGERDVAGGAEAADAG